MRGGFGYDGMFLNRLFYNSEIEIDIIFISGRGPRIFRGRGGPMLGGPMGPVPGPMGPSFGTQFYSPLPS